MRLTFVVESGTDVRLVDGLAERYAVRVLARRIPGGREINHPPARPLAVAIGPGGRARFAAWVGRRLALGAGAYDAILVQGYGAAALAANLAARALRKPAAMLVCSPLERYYRCRRDWTGADKPFRASELGLLRVTAELNARAGQRYVVLSRFLGDVVRSHGTRRPVHVVPVYGVDPNRFRPADEPREAVRRRLGIPVQGELVFFGSRIAPEKDAATLLRAAHRLVDGGRDLRLLHLSGGYEAFRDAARAAGLAARVVARDAVHPVTELPDWYRAADLFVQASREEGLGFAPLEALACGIPVVATAVGGLRETILPGETGWTYPAGDDAALAAQMAAALDDSAEGRRRAAAGRAMVIRRFAAERVFADLAKVLEQDA